MTDTKSMISAQMDTELIDRLTAYAKAKQISRSAAVRDAITLLLDSRK